MNSEMCQVCGCADCGECVCPSCRVCGVVGDPSCYVGHGRTGVKGDHGMIKNEEQLAAYAAREETDLKQGEAEAEADLK